MAGNWTNEQIGWIIKERQQGKMLDQITKDFNEKSGRISIKKVVEICKRHLMQSTKSSLSDDSDIQTRKLVGFSKHFRRSEDYTESRTTDTQI